MPRKNSQGKFIIAAGEVAHFIVCPEAWRLSALEKQAPLSDPSHATGQALHKVWARDFEESIVFSRYVRMIIEILFLLVLVTLFKLTI